MVDALLAPAGFAFAFAIDGVPGLALAILPLLVLIGVFAREREARLDQTLELSQAYRGTVFLLGDVVEADDEYTGRSQPGRRRARARRLRRVRPRHAQRRKPSSPRSSTTSARSAFPNAIINKPGPLDADERAMLNTHTIEGEQLLERVGGLLAEVGGLVRSCHERWDGTGYPDGLAGEEIPIVARIVAAATPTTR